MSIPLLKKYGLHPQLFQLFGSYDRQGIAPDIFFACTSNLCVEVTVKLKDLDDLTKVKEISAAVYTFSEEIVEAIYICLKD